jgi:hypothetical protein
VALMISSIVVAPGSLFWLHALFTLMAWMLHAPEEIRVRYLTDMANVNFLTGNCLDTICRVVIYSGMGGMFGAKLNMHRRWRWAAACTNCVGLVMWAAVCEATLGLEQHTSWFVKYSLLPIAINGGGGFSTTVGSPRQSPVPPVPACAAPVPACADSRVGRLSPLSSFFDSRRRPFRGRHEGVAWSHEIAPARQSVGTRRSHIGAARCPVSQRCHWLRRSRQQREKVAPLEHDVR